MDMDSVQKAGSFLGSAGIMVMDDTVCMVWVALILERFFHHESCGQCTPCREGTGWLHRVLERPRERRGNGERRRSAAQHRQQHAWATPSARWPTRRPCRSRALVTKFRAEFDAHVTLGRCPLRSPAEPPRAHADGRDRRPHDRGRGRHHRHPAPRSVSASRSRTTAGTRGSRSPATAACAWSRSRSRRSCRSPATPASPTAWSSHANSEKTKLAQRAVLEFLLLNHPIDCPICDQAGECKLQEYYMDYDRAAQPRSRCPTRCTSARRSRSARSSCSTRSAASSARAASASARRSRRPTSSRSSSAATTCELDVAPGKTLDNPYSMNVIDICPVGALTSRDFRFRARVWYLERTRHRLRRLRQRLQRRAVPSRGAALSLPSPATTTT